MLRVVLIAWVVWASSFAAPASTLAAPSTDGSVDAANIAAIDAAPNRPASTQPSSIAASVGFPVATAARPAQDARVLAPDSVDPFDRRAQQRRILPRRAPPRLGDDGFH